LLLLQLLALLCHFGAHLDAHVLDCNAAGKLMSDAPMRREPPPRSSAS
jgi:hypothetical protein